MVASGPGRRADEVADRDGGAPDAAGERRADLGVAQLQLGLVQGCLQARDLAAGIGLFGGGLIEPLLRAGAARDQLRGAIDLERGQGQRRFRLLDAALDLIDGGFVRLLLDHEQEVTLLDVLAFLEQAFLQKALDAGAQLDLVARLNAAREGGCGLDLLLHHRDHGDRGWRRGRLGPLGLAAVGNKRRHHGGGDEEAPTYCTAHRASPAKPVRTDTLLCRRNAIYGRSVRAKAAAAWCDTSPPLHHAAEDSQSATTRDARACGCGWRAFGAWRWRAPRSRST
jgi:hypothetical protein